jgi:hypothetical protein
MTLETFSTAGGLFAVLAFVHFFADFLFQSHEAALAKSHDWKVRANHCLWYCFFFLPLLAWLGLDGWRFGAALVMLYGSHFIIDTYYGVLLWAKHIRKFPQFTARQTMTHVDCKYSAVSVGSIVKTKGADGIEWEHVVTNVVDSSSVETRLTDESALKQVFSTPVGAILCIAVDQIFHLAFLWTVVWLALWRAP